MVEEARKRYEDHFVDNIYFKRSLDEVVEGIRAKAASEGGHEEAEQQIAHIISVFDEGRREYEAQLASFFAEHNFSGASLKEVINGVESCGAELRRSGALLLSVKDIRQHVDYVKNVFMAEKGRQQIAGIKSRASAVGRNIRGAFRSGIKNIVSSFSGISGVYTGHVMDLPGRGMAAANHKLSDGLGAVRGKLGDAYQAARNNVMTKKNIDYVTQNWGYIAASAGLVSVLGAIPFVLRKDTKHDGLEEAVAAALDTPIPPAYAVAPVPTATQMPTPDATPLPASTQLPVVPVVTSTPTQVPTGTPTKTPTAYPTALPVVPTLTPEPTATHSPIPAITSTPASTAIPDYTATPVITPTPSPTAVPEPTATMYPPTPTKTVIPTPTRMPTASPTRIPQQVYVFDYSTANPVVSGNLEDIASLLAGGKDSFGRSIPQVSIEAGLAAVYSQGAATNFVVDMQNSSVAVELRNGSAIRVNGIGKNELDSLITYFTGGQ